MGLLQYRSDESFAVFSILVIRRPTCMLAIVEAERPLGILQEYHKLALNRQAVKLPWRHPVEERAAGSRPTQFDRLLDRAAHHRTG